LVHKRANRVLFCFETSRDRRTHIKKNGHVEGQVSLTLKKSQHALLGGVIKDCDILFLQVVCKTAGPIDDSQDQAHLSDLLLDRYARDNDGWWRTPVPWQVSVAQNCLLRERRAAKADEDDCGKRFHL